MALDSEATFKQSFEAKLLEYEEQHQGSQRKPWTQEKINEVINHIRRGRVAMTSEQRRTPMEYYWMSKYDILGDGADCQLIFKKKSTNNSTVRIIPREHYFDAIKECHISLGHGGRDKIINTLKAKYYIPKKAVEILVALCPTCEMKKSVPKKSIGTRPTVIQDFNTRGQVELIDFQSCPDGDYKWLLYYEDSASKFMSLRPLKTIEPNEVALELMKIFMIFGAPCTLLSDCDFIEKVIQELNGVWPECKTVLGSPLAQGIVDTSSRDVEHKLRLWMSENKSSKWSLGCHIIQYQKNTSFHYRIGKTPYKALFGNDPQSDVGGPDTETELIVNIKTEKCEPEEEINDDTPSVYIHITPKIEYEHIEKPENVEEPSSKIKSEKSFDSNEDSCEDRYSSMSYCDPFDCQKDQNVTTDGSFKCSSSKQASCHQEESETHGSKLLCASCHRDVNIQYPNIECQKGTKRAAEETQHNNAKKPPPLAIGETVLIKVPKGGCDPLTAKNITGKIIDFQNGVYRVGTHSGILKNWFARQDLHVLAEEYNYDIPDTPVSLQEAVAKEFVLRKCSCKPARNQCHNNRCACFKNNVSCGSQCHSNLSCVNK